MKHEFAKTSFVMYNNNINMITIILPIPFLGMYLL